MSGDSDRQRGHRLNRVAVQWALFLALGIVAVAYFVMPVRAAALPGWSAEFWATEGGEALMPNGGLPENTFSLKGSSAAIEEVRGDCR